MNLNAVLNLDNSRFLGGISGAQNAMAGFSGANSNVMAGMEALRETLATLAATMAKLNLHLTLRGGAEAAAGVRGVGAAAEGATGGVNRLHSRLTGAVHAAGAFGSSLAGIVHGVQALNTIASNLGRIREGFSAIRSAAARVGSAIQAAFESGRMRAALVAIVGVGASVAGAVVAFKALRATASAAMGAIRGIGQAAAASMGAVSSTIGSIVDGLKKMLFNPFAALAAGGGAAALAFVGLKKSINEAADMEQMETSFSVLLGSMTAAQTRMKELARFAAETPFELPEVAAASRTLQTLTQGALSTGKGLTLVGDVASGTNAPFEELAVTVGRLYDGLQSGRAVGESMARLQELGAISGSTRAKLEALQETGKKGDDVWSVAAMEMSKYTGMMKKQSNTWAGLMSNLRDSINGLFREFGKPLIDAFKPMLVGAIKLSDSLAGKAREWGQTLANAVTTTKNLLAQGHMGEMVGLTLKLGFLDACQALAEKLIDLFDMLAPKVSAIFDGLTSAVQGLGAIIAGTIKQGIIGALAGVKIMGHQLIPDDVAAAGHLSGKADIQRGQGLMQDGATSVKNGIGNGAIGGFIKGITMKETDARRRLEELIAGATEHRPVLPKEVAKAVAKPDYSGDAKKGEGEKLGEGDRLAKIGLFIGGRGPANDHARRTSENTAKMHAELQKMNQNLLMGRHSEGQSWS